MSLKRLMPVILALMMPAMCMAQLDTATILGTVTDQSGAVVPEAKIEVHNIGTGTTVTLTTGSGGEFIAPALAVGNYQVTASAKGFKSLTQSGIHLNVSDRIRLTLALTPGLVSQTVTVSGAAPLLQTASSTLGGLVTEHQVDNLPLNGRALTQVLATVPGVSLLGTSPSINGGAMDRLFETTSRFLLDGTDSGQIDSDLPDAGYGTEARMTRTSVESIAQVRVQTSDFDAQYGSSAAAVINFITKSGTNHFHGSAFEYYRNGALDAKLYNFNPSVPEQKGSFLLNQFGGSLGGPIRRDKMFFFGDYEGDRQSQSTLASTFTPVQSYRDSLAPALLPIINSLPLPNGPVSPADPRLGTYQANLPNDLTENTFMVKLDDHLTSSDHFSARYNWNKSFTANTFGVGQGQTDQIPYLSQLAKLSYTKTITPNLLNQLGFGLNRLRTNAVPASTPETLAFPVMDILGGIAEPGPSLFNQRVGNTSYTYLDTLSWVHGHHQIKVGGQVVRIQENKNVIFQNYLVFLGLDDTPGSFASNQPFELLTIGWPTVGQRNVQMGYFVQDDYQATRSLTLNLGLRYDLSTVIREAHRRNSNFDFATGELLPPGTKPFNVPTRNFAPRIGFAWNPSGANKWVIRGGYGIFYTPINPVMAQENAANNPSFGQNRTVTMFDIPGLTGFPTPDVQSFPSLGSVYAQPKDFKSAYEQDWNLNIQRDLGWDTVLQVGYIGNKGTHYMYIVNANEFDPEVGARPFPNFGDINLEATCCGANYNALQTSLRHRFSHGIAINFNYTYSHALDLGGLNFGTAAQNVNDLAAEYGNADYDTRHYVEFDYTYQLPKAPALPGWLGNGWQINGITVMRSGTPVDVVCGCDPVGTGVANGRPNAVSGVSPRPSHYSLPFNQINMNAYSSPVGTGNYGDVARNSLYGPSVFNWDFSAFKTFKLPESQAIEFRAEFFNIFNTPEFSAPSANLASPATFGKSLSTITAAGGFGSNRQIQFAVRYSF